MKSRARLLRDFAIALAFTVATLVPPLACGATLRIAYGISPETLDPVRAGDVFTQAVVGTLFDQLYTYDYLVRPLRLRPLAAADMPSVSADGREITVRIRPGIRFTHHSAFGNRPRELIAEDFVYSVKRFFDPVIRAPVVSLIAGKIEGLDELGVRAARNATPFDYDARVSGLVALDRYTVRIRLTKPDPSFIYFLANPDLSIVPREAVEADGDEFGRHPTGSGPYVVREYKPGTRVVLERNPTYRAMRWEDVATPGPGDPEWATAFLGRRFPLPDRVELRAISEPTPGLLALEGGEIDVLASPVPAATDTPAAALRSAARLAKGGFTLVHTASPTLRWISFNMRDPTIGGTDKATIALRRAIAMAIDDEEMIRVVMNGAASAARYWIPPGMGGHDPAYRYPVRYDPGTANALLDRMGYRKGRDGYRRRPDGGELALSMLISTSSEARHTAEYWKRTFERIGIRLDFEFVHRAERGNRVGTCHYQITGDAWLFDWPDGSNLMIAFYGRDAGTDGNVNMACMEDRDFDALYERLIPTPLGDQQPPAVPAHDRAPRCAYAGSAHPGTRRHLSHRAERPWPPDQSGHLGSLSLSRRHCEIQVICGIAGHSLAGLSHSYANPTTNPSPATKTINGLPFGRPFLFRSG